jgi:hypothetical protein
MDIFAVLLFTLIVVVYFIPCHQTSSEDFRGSGVRGSVGRGGYSGKVFSNNNLSSKGNYNLNRGYNRVYGGYDRNYYGGCSNCGYLGRYSPYNNIIYDYNNNSDNNNDNLVNQHPYYTNNYYQTDFDDNNDNNTKSDNIDVNINIREEDN